MPNCQWTEYDSCRIRLGSEIILACLQGIESENETTENSKSYWAYYIDE